MKRMRSIRVTALLLAALSLSLAGVAEALEPIGEDGIAVEGLETVPDELPGELADVELARPEATQPPGATAAPKKGGAKKIPFLTSYNYPKDKVYFEDEIWDILTKRWGLRDYQAAGLMSSIQAESGFCPYNVQGRGGADDRGKYEFSVGDSVGFGLCQWTGAGRKAALLRHAQAHGSGELVWDFDIQMGFMGSELDFDALMSTHNLYEASEWAVMFYERPDQSHANSWPGVRYERGKALYKAHTGRDYEEPELRFRVSRDGEAPGPEGLTLAGVSEPGGLVVRSNYYWRLTLVDETEADWLGVEAPSFYLPEQMEDCVCGYACEGDKPLTLTVRQAPPLGRTWRATLRFELYRGGHEIVEVPVAATCTPRDALRRLAEADWHGTALGLAGAVIAGVRAVTKRSE